MKRPKMISSLLVALLVLLSFTPVAHAIGFNAEDIYEAVFVIYSGNSLGSGFAIGNNCIITNAHVIDDINETFITTCDDEKFKTEIVALNHDIDIAVLSVEGGSFAYLEFEDYANTKIGDDVYAIGAPNGMTYTLTKGTLSAKDRIIGDYPYLQLDAALNEGNSGGPLLTDSGKVIGVNSMKLSNSEGIGLAIPMTEVFTYLDSIGISPDSYGVDIGDSNTPAETPPLSSENDSHVDDAEVAGALSSVENTIYITEKEPINRVLGIGCSVSIFFNVCLLIILLRLKYGDQKPRLTSKDRTDFEIEILE